VRRAHPTFIPPPTDLLLFGPPPAIIDLKN
jgi:hypothetical protein